MGSVVLYTTLYNIIPHNERFQFIYVQEVELYRTF